MKGAKIANGALDVDLGKWAITVGDYKGPDITNKTLVSRATMQDNRRIPKRQSCVSIRSAEIILTLSSMLEDNLTSGCQAVAFSGEQTIPNLDLKR